MDQHFEDRARFVIELARRLHQYGTSAGRLETAVDSVCQRFRLTCDVLSTPTSVIVSLADRDRGDDPLPELTKVIRMEPGGVNLKRLSKVDEVAERVFAGELDISEGYRALRAIVERPKPWSDLVTVLSFGATSASVAALFHTGWFDLVVATVLGTLVGVMSIPAGNNVNFGQAFEAIAALIVAVLAAAVHALWQPLALNSVLISALIVLLPGLMLTTAVTELAAQHMVSGVARMAGAAAILLKLAFGTVAGLAIAKVFGWTLDNHVPTPVPAYAEWLALLLSSVAFAVLFRAAQRDWLLVMASAWLGYGATRFGGAAFGAEFGVFVGGFVVGIAANAYARFANRPGAIVRVPGIILLVPGSVGFKSLFLVFEKNVDSGLETASVLALSLISLVAGLLFANIALSPRRSLS